MIYRPPDSDFDVFEGKLEDILFSINKKNKDCVILGGFNIDVSKDDVVKRDFVNTLHSFSFFCTINQFTRVTLSTRTVIDNIITNIRNTRLESGVVLSDITDHFPIVFFLDLANKNELSLQKTKIKVLNERILKLLIENLQAKTWKAVYDCNNTDTAYDNLINEITNSICCTIPEKNAGHRATGFNPWLTKGILKSITHKNKLYKRFLRSPSVMNKDIYTSYRNKLTNIIRKSKNNHYIHLIKASQGDSKRSWEVLNEVLNKRKNNTVLPNALGLHSNLDNKYMQDIDLANNFNNYFNSIGEKLFNKIVASGDHFRPLFAGFFCKFFLYETN